MVTVRLAPMTEAEYATWRSQTVAAYADDHRRAGTYGADEALDRAAEEFDDLLPHGLETEHMLLFTGRDETGAPTGILWLGLVHPRGAPDTAFLYDIAVLPERRGQGYGKAMLASGEDVVRRRGARALALNVFGDNPEAIGLYRSAGYQVTTQQMRKSLD